ncbi:MAG TPA: DUF1998 domain-containing protein [Terriglobia bacterium]|nr:DUF1998 domain-containing protein [Terriglobia bacterium]
MSKKARGQLRRSQVITTWGPGALLDLPRHSAIIGGLEFWPKTADLDEIPERRLRHKLRGMTAGGVPPRFYAPPADPRDAKKGIRAWRFPEWFVVQEKDDAASVRSRRLVYRTALDRSRFEGLQVVPTRFVRGCPRGHVDDIDWKGFVHQGESCGRKDLRIEERGTSGDLADLIVTCGCGKRRSLHDASMPGPLGVCHGRMPWLGRGVHEDCNRPSRLLIRTAANAYFAQVVSVLSLPDHATEVQRAVRDLWDDLQIVDTAEELTTLKKKPRIAAALEAFADTDVMAAIAFEKGGSSDDRPTKVAELDTLLSVPEGFGDDVPIDPDFHARRLPESVWRHSGRYEGIESVTQLHRLREVQALAGFTRFEAVTPDINGDYESDVERARLAEEPTWFPAVENRGEGIFLKLRPESVNHWLARPGVLKRLQYLADGHKRWMAGRKTPRDFPGGPYILLHTLSHLLIQSLAMRCGYPASSIRERVYTDAERGRFGLLLYTGSPDAEGTLGGLVQQARQIEGHLKHALRNGALCSNDPICAQHAPGESMEQRWLHGAACHGCTLVGETSCEMRNDYLDRALVVPALGVPDAAFFGAAE